jgi:peptide/nickel transport system ATP-binding protein
MLEIKKLSMSFYRYGEKFFKRTPLRVITDLNVSVAKGEIVSIIGSSGSGKSLLAHEILGITPENAKVEGEIYFDKKLLTQEIKEALRGRDIALIPQSINMLDPMQRVGKQIYRSALRKWNDSAKAWEETDKILSQFQLELRVKDMYPHELSGGMARRILIAIATVSGAKLLIADEPTTGLDTPIAREILSLLKSLKKLGHSLLMITHDIEAAKEISDRIAVFYGGTTVEFAAVERFSKAETLQHPYSKALIKALPDFHFEAPAGRQPAFQTVVDRCSYEHRCCDKSEKCKNEPLEMQTTESGFVRCHHA